MISVIMDSYFVQQQNHYEWVRQMIEEKDDVINKMSDDRDTSRSGIFTARYHLVVMRFSHGEEISWYSEIYSP